MRRNRPEENATMRIAAPVIGALLFLLMGAYVYLFHTFDPAPIDPAWAIRADSLPPV